MFGNDPQSMKLTLLEMARSAHNDSLGQGVDPAGKLQEYINRDPRFQGFASDRLAEETMERVRNGNSQAIDLDDPFLKGARSGHNSGRVDTKTYQRHALIYT
jgi:hypothetical protein